MSNSKMMSEPDEKEHAGDERRGTRLVRSWRGRYDFGRESFDRSRYGSGGCEHGKYNRVDYDRRNRDNRGDTWRARSEQDNKAYASHASDEASGSVEQETAARPEPYVCPQSSSGQTKRFGRSYATACHLNQLADVPVRVCGREPPESLGFTFLRAGLCESLLVNMHKVECTWPMPIQRYAIPIVQAGRDLLACAQTGSGKIVAFMPPLINRLLLLDSLEHTRRRPYILIVAPKQSFVQQICDTARKLAFGTPLRICGIYGAIDVGYQQRLLNAGCHVLVVSNGRLHQLLSRGSISLSNVKCLVLTEVNRMLQLGYRKLIDRLMSEPEMPPKGARQTLLFSATCPDNVQRLAEELLHDHVSVSVGVMDSANAAVEQVICDVKNLRKHAMLETILAAGDPRGTLIFVETKCTVEWLTELLQEWHITTASINSDRTMSERDVAVRDFRSGRKAVLVATFVLSPRLNISQVRHLINYDVPKTIGEFVYRVRRISFVGNKGRVTSFYDPAVDQRMAANLVQLLNEIGQPVPDFLLTAANMNAGSWGGVTQPGSLSGGVHDGTPEQLTDDEDQWNC